MLPYERISALVRDEQVVPLGGRAELEAFGGELRLEVQVERGAARRRVSLALRGPEHPMRRLEFSIALLATLFASALALLGLRALPGEAGGCAAGLCIALGVDVVADLQSIHSPLMEVLAGVAQGAAPATLSHLLLVHPRQLRMVRDLPRLKFLPYGLALGLVALATLLLVRDSRLWEVPERLLGIWLVMGLGLLSLSAAARTRPVAARRPGIRGTWLFVIGAALFASLLVLTASEGISPAVSRGCAVLFALGIAFVSFRSSRRLDGEHLRPARWAVVQLLQTSIALAVLLPTFALLSGARFSDLEGGDAVLAVSGVFCLVAWFDQGRSLAWWLVGRVLEPEAPRFEELQRGHELLLEEARDADGFLGALAITASKALDCAGVTAFLRMGDSAWRLAYQKGEPACGEVHARAGELTLARQGASTAARRVVHLSWLPDALPGHSAVLHTARVGLLVGLYPTGGEARALLLGTGLRRSFDVNSETRRFLELLGSQTSHALERWDFEEKLVGSARMAAVGHAAAGLAHDLGRPLGEIYLEARKGLPSESMRCVERSASECLDLLGAFVRDARASHEQSARLESVLLAALDRITHLESSRRVLVRLSPGLPCVSDPRSLQRVFENLLENAFQWNPRTEPVEMTATECDDRVVVRIIDHGPGMSAQQVREAFGRFRSGRRGTGLGLAICRDITEKLGASILLDNGVGGGTVATVCLPTSGNPAAHG